MVALCRWPRARASLKTAQAALEAAPEPMLEQHAASAGDIKDVVARMLMWAVRHFFHRHGGLWSFTYAIATSEHLKLRECLPSRGTPATVMCLCFVAFV